MRINNNILAMNSCRNMKINQHNIQKFTQSLSSGKRINKAGDDAAGLSISEKMRAQIRGLNQASRNVQDGISLIQTAEGAMNEIHSILQRGRELAVQASNDTYTQDDRSKIQDEIQSLISEVDNISNSTEFNNIKVLKGGGILPPPSGGGGGVSYTPASDTKFTSKNEITEALRSYMLEKPEQMISNFYGISAKANTPIDIVYQNDAAGGAVAWVSSMVNTATGEASNFKLVVDTADFLNPNNLWISKDRILAHEMVHAVMGASGMNMKDSDMPKWFKEGTAEYFAGADERLAGSISILGSEEAVVNAINASPSSSHFYSASYAATKYLDDVLKSKGSSIKNVMQGLADGNLKSLDTVLKDVGAYTNGLSEFMTDFKNNGANFIRTKLDLDPSDGDSDGVGSITGNAGDVGVIPDGGTAKDNPLNNFDVTWSSSTGYAPTSPNVSILADAFSDSGVIKIQAGANTNQDIDIRFNTINSTSLGIHGLDVSVDAKSAITNFNSAIITLSSERSRAGALQNKLEYSLKISDINAENTQAAESRIRDADIAKEMMGYTKNNILLQAANSMLAQANQGPQGVLQLLR